MLKSAMLAFRDALVSLRDTLKSSTSSDPVFEDENPLVQGAIKIRKRPEDITVEDVLEAYSLPDIFDGVPIIDLTWEEMLEDTEYASYTSSTNPKPFIWTARGAKLIGEKAIFNKYGVESTTVQELYSDEIVWWRNKTLNPDYTSSYQPTMSNIANFNGRRLKDIQSAHESIDIGEEGSHPNCVGLKLSRVYPVRFTGSVNIYKPQTFHDALFSPQRPFIIDGEVEGNAVGGLVSRFGLMATKYSLVLRKAKFMRKNEEGYWQFYIDASNNQSTGSNQSHGIDQLQITDCVFEQVNPTSDNLQTRDGHGYASHYIFLYFRNRAPQNPTGEDGFINYNVIRDVFIKGNTVYGTSFIRSDIARFSNSYRCVQNTFFMGGAEENFESGRPFYALLGNGGSCIGHITDNDITASNHQGGGIDRDGNKNSTPYTTQLSYYSCPMWVVGNVFHGKERIVAKRGKADEDPDSSSTYTAVEVETSQIYFLRNTIENIVEKHTIFDHGNNAEKYYYGHGLYDSYMSVAKLWYCNNIIRNVLSLSHRRTDSRGLFKGKGESVPYYLRPGWRFADVVRYYVGNTFTVDEEWVRDKWAKATEVSEGFDPYDPYTSYGKARTDPSWKPSQWLIADKYGSMCPMPVYRLKCQKCGLKYLPTATVCTNEDCSYYGQAHFTPIYPSDHFPYLVGEKTYDHIFEQEFDDNVTIFLSEVLTSGKESSHYIPAPARHYVLKDNIIDMREFCFGGMLDNSSIKTVNFTCSGNTFKARRMSSVYPDGQNKVVLWSSKRLEKDTPSDPVESEYLFNVVPVDYYKSTCVLYDGTTPVGENRKVYSAYNGQSYLVERPIKASVIITDNKICVDDFSIGGNTIPTEVQFICVKYGGKPDIYKDYLNVGKTKNQAERKIDGNTSPANVVISGNRFVDKQGNDMADSSNVIVYHKKNSASGATSNLTPTTPSS